MNLLASNKKGANPFVSLGTSSQTIAMDCDIPSLATHTETNVDVSLHARVGN